MHRSLTEIASVRSSVLSLGTRHASTVTKRGHPSSPHLSKRQYDDMAKKTKGIVLAAARKEGKPGWGHDKSHDGETRRFTEVVKRTQNPAKVDSLEKQQLFSNPNDMERDAGPDWDEESAPVGALSSPELPLGSFVEIRRSGAVAHGVILRRSTVSHAVLLHLLATTGEMWEIREHDVMFLIPNFVPIDLVVRCGREVTPQGDHEIAARVRVLKELRNFELAHERKVIRMSQTLKSLYTQLKNPDKKQWSLTTTDEAARLVDPNSQTISRTAKFVVHKYLFENSKYFEAEHSRFLTTNRIWVRSQEEVEDIEAVDRLVQKKDPRLNAFVAKAKRIIQSSRERELKTWNEKISFQQEQRVEFSSDDWLIIRWFLHSLEPRRSIQTDPYLVSQCYIIKQIGMFEGRDVDDDIIHQLLIELGVLPPWDDRVTRHAGLWRSLNHPRQLEVQPDATGQVLVSSPKTGQVLGPEDFYDHDIVDSLRHDFGNMAVYVIDDFDAEELDDGLSVEPIPSEPGSNWLHVHIADPTSVIPPTHAFAHQAFRRVETAYFTDRSIPMLPRKGIIEDLSLGSHKSESQPVMTFSAKISRDGDIVDYMVRPGVVRNIHILRYDAVNEAAGWERYITRKPFSREDTPRSFDLTSYDQNVLHDLQRLRDVGKAILRARTRNGQIAFSAERADVSIDPRPVPDIPLSPSAPYAWSGFPTFSYQVLEFRTQESGSRQLVSEAMKTAGRVASMFFRDRGIPAIRRVLWEIKSPTEGGLERVMQMRDEDGFVDQADYIGAGLTWSGAEYLTSPGPHTILGIPAHEGYSRVTSPLRRFADMLAHWQIKHALLNPSNPATGMFSDDWLQKFASYMGSQELLLKRASQTQNYFLALRYIHRWKAEWERGEHRDMPSPLDNMFARILEPPVRNGRKQNLQYAVTIPGLGIQGTLINADITTELPVGALVLVKLTSVNLLLRAQFHVEQR